MFVSKYFIILIFMLRISDGFSQIDPDLDARLERRTHSFAETTLPYRLYIPDAYNADLTYPLILFLHGALWRGSDNVTQLDNELAVYWIADSNQVRNPGFVVFPQCPQGQSWETVAGAVKSFPASPMLDVVNDLLDSLLLAYNIDSSRIYLAGKSMGGQGAYGMLSRYPARFAAIVPVAGPFVYGDITVVDHVPMWIFHNRDDNSVSVEQSRHMVSLLSGLGRDFLRTHCFPETGECGNLSHAEIDLAILTGVTHLYSEFDDSGHQLEPNVVATYGLFRWLNSQNTQNTSARTHRLAPSSALILLPNYPNPFNESTRIVFELRYDSEVSLTVNDQTGRSLETRSLGTLGAGLHKIRWDAGNLPTGHYNYRLRTPLESRTGTLTLIK